MHTYLLHHLLANSAGKWPSNLAVLLKEMSLTYAELSEGSDRIASFLLSDGIAPGDRVGLMMEKSIESVVSVFGVLKAGAAYVPIDLAAPGGRLRHILDTCRIKIVIASPRGVRALFDGNAASPEYPSTVLVTGGRAAAEKFGDLPVRMMYWEELFDVPALTLPNVPRTDLDPAYILHTSGSTGVPKGVVIAHRNALAFVEIASEFFAVRPEDRLCNHAPLSFDLSMFDIYVAIRSGAAVVLVPENLSVFPIKLAEYIQRTGITVWNSVSSVLSLLAVRGNLGNCRLSALRLVIFSGEVLPVKYLRTLRMHLKKAVFYNIYGQTEANSSTWYRVDEIPADDAWKIPIGRAFPNFEVFLLDEAGRVVDAPGGEGEIYVKASTVALGYWEDDVRTRERFVPDPRFPGSSPCVYRTGDLGRIGEDGNLLFGGRKDHLVKSRGYRIELEEIEIALNSYPYIRQAAAIPVPDELLGNRILACVSPLGGAFGDVQAVRRHCGSLLPHYMVPDEILFFEELPMNANGKVDRTALLQKLAAGHSHKAGINIS